MFKRICSIAVSLSLLGQLYAATFYVDASRPDDSGLGTSWDSAKKTIQAAVDLTVDGDVVLVTNGVYATGTTQTPGYTLKNRVAVTKNITLRSVNGADVTVIEGSGTNWFNTSSAVRCVFMKKGTLQGFTLQNGATYAWGLGSSDEYERAGGGINMVDADANTVVSNCIIRSCISLNGGGSYYGTLNNCTLTGNTASHGGGSYSGTLKNCTLTGNTASYGGGSYYGTLNNCTLTSNTASERGGGSYGGTLNNCTLTGNTASYGGGGSSGGTLNNCTLTGNTASEGGGFYGYSGGTLNNCTLTGNTASSGGGSHSGTLNNCTLTGNTASSGGGSAVGTLNNCIVWGNTREDRTPNNYEGSTFYYSCSTPLPSGPGNIDADPQWVDSSDLRLRIGSPCLDAGDNVYASLPSDLAGNPRIQNATVDMGVYEGGVLATELPVFDPPSWTRFTHTLKVAISCATEGAIIYYTLDGSEPTQNSSIYSTPIAIFATTTIRARIYRDGYVSALSLAVYRPDTFYVDASRPDDSGLGTSWDSAKKTIQAAVDLTVDGDVVLVTNGVYATGTTQTPGYTLKNRVAVTKNITLRSVNGADVTVIEGSGTNWFNTSSAVRCVFMKKGTLQGFTLQNGATYDWSLGSSEQYERAGGGINMVDADANTVVSNCIIRSCISLNGGGSAGGTLNNCTLTGNTASFGGGSYSGTLNNCTLTGNTASEGGGFYGYYGGTLNNCTLTGNTASYGGGSAGGMLNNCTLTGNTASYGGGSAGGMLNNCTLTGNTASWDGGGSSGGTLNNCTLTGNTASWDGGGSSGGTLNYCTMTGNTARSGGGSRYGTLNNCTLTGNTASSGGGSAGGTLNNCTLTGNTAWSGGGSSGETLYNCIVWGNTREDGTPNNYEESTFYYSCSTPLPPGPGNIDADPQCVDALDLRLRIGSPCLDAGDNVYTDFQSDLAGNPRIQNATVDMGAYEGGVLATELPVFDPPPGTRFTQPISVVITCNSAGAVVRYTTDGSEPTEASAVYSEPLELVATTTLRAKAFEEGLVSAQLAGDYFLQATTPVFTPISGSVATNELVVSIACSTPDSIIRYSLDESEPTEESPQYTNALMLTASTIVKAKAYAQGRLKSETATASYTVFQAVAKPVITPASGTTATNSILVGIACATLDAAIYYTLDGSEPTESSLQYARGSKITITESATLKAKAFYDGMIDSDTAYAVFTVIQTVATPTLLPEDGTEFTSLRKVTMSCTTPGAQIRYTTDLTEPLADSPLYTGAFNISQTTTFKVKAFKAGMADSAVVQATYFRVSPLGDAIDASNLQIATGGDSQWFSQTAVTHDGVDAAQSGRIAHDQSTWMEARLTGAGVVTFLWKTSCEDDPDADNWDYLLFSVDGIEQERADGDSGWRQVSCLLGEGSHVLRWEYHKDESISVGEDCAWVDQLVFTSDQPPPETTTTTPVPVPCSWIDAHPLLLSHASGDYEAAAHADIDGDGHAAWQEYVSGSIPTERQSVLRTHLSISNGVPRITWMPDLGEQRIYRVEGKSSLDDPEWAPTNSVSRFFRVVVDMP